MRRSLAKNLKLGIIILGYFMGPSPFRKDLSGSCAKAVAMNKKKNGNKSCDMLMNKNRKERKREGSELVLNGIGRI